MASLKQKTKKVRQANQVNERQNKISLGARVKMAVNGHLQAWEIVRVGESDISCGKIANDAPLIQLIWGRTEGERVEGKVGNREVEIEIREVQSLA